MTTILNSSNTFDLFFRDFFNSSNQFTTPDKSKNSYPVDIYQDGTGMHFEIPCIGINKEDIKISVDSNILRIMYNKKESSEETKERSYLCKGVANRSFNLGYKFSSKFDLTEVNARYDNGLLIVNIPYSAENEVKEISIH